MLWIASHLGPSEGFNWHSSILELEVWCGIDRIIGHSQGIWPEIWSDGIGPPMMGMGEHCACHFLKLLELPLCNTILMMCCNSGKGEALSLLQAQLPPDVGGEDPIVHMIVLTGDPMLLKNLLNAILPSMVSPKSMDFWSQTNPRPVAWLA